MVTEKIRELRIKYEKEKESLYSKHKEALRVLNEQLSKAKAIDYAAPYRARYADLCAAMEAYYQKILRTEKDIHGLDFYAEKYMTSTSNHNFENYFRDDNVEDVFQALMEECHITVKDLETSHTVEEYAKLLSNFCDLLSIMHYIVKNSSSLLKASGIPNEDKQRAISEVERKINDENERYGEASKKENLNCHAELMELASELESIYKKTSSELLGDTIRGDDGQYRYLIGFNIEKVPENDACFCEEVLEVGREKIGREPVYLEPRTGRCNVVINAPGEFLSSRAYEELIRNIYFSFASRVDKSMLQMGYIDCHRGPSVLQAMYTGMDTSDANSIKRLGAEGTFCYNEVKERDPSKLKSCFDKIYDDCNNIVAHYGNVMDHNLVTDKNKVPLKLIVVNFYPVGFVASYGDSQPYSSLKMQMKEYSDSGCMFVVCRDINAPLENDDMLIDAKTCNAIEISLSEESYAAWKASGKPLGSCEFTIDGRPATMDITRSDFDGMRYWDKLKEFYSKKKVFALRDVFRRTDAATNGWQSPPSAFDDGVIDIPLGLRGAEEYSLRYPISSAGHTLIYGGSGSGKSSFLHTLILSMCYKYSSDDIQIYLADFKKLEFSFYARYQLPHIKYYLIKPGVSEVCAVFDMIDRIRMERSDLLERYDCPNIAVYNKKVKENNDGTMKKMPVIFFIVDEYQVIDTVTGAGSNVMSKIYKAINTTLSQARAMGINIFLCAQEIDKINKIQSENVKTFILMGAQLETDRQIRTYFLGNNSSMDDMKSIKDYLAVEKEGRCLIKSVDGPVADKVRVAYAGEKDEDKAEYIEAIRELRKKEEISMVLGGSEEPMEVSKVSNYREELLKDRKKIFSLPLGIGSTSGFSLPMVFDTNENGDHYGWMVYSESSECVNNIIRNAILAFLYKTSALGYDYIGQRIKQRVLHFATGRNYKGVLGKEYLKDTSAFAFAESHIRWLNVNQSVYDLCSLIMDLGDEMKRRSKDMGNKEVYFSETREYPPYLVVLQSLGWLNESSINEVLKERYEKEKPVNTDKPRKADTIANVDLLSEEDMDAFISDGIAKGLDALTEKTAGPERRMKGAEVIKTLNELFERGSKYGIFVIANPESRGYAERVFGSKAAENAVYWDNCVYGTFNEYINDNGNNNRNDGSEDEPLSMICYVGEGGIKTRLYDYSPDTQNEWWQEFKESIKEKSYGI